MPTENSDTVLASVVTLDESETAQVEALVKGRTHVTTESYIWGEFTVAEIAELEKLGFPITVHNVPALTTPVETDVYARTTGKEIYIIGLRGPWLWGDELAALGVEPIQKVSESEYMISMPGPNVEALSQKYFVYKIHQRTTSAKDFDRGD